MIYRRKASRRHETRTTNIRNRVSIHERPAEADGKRFGDRETDLIVDRDSNAILTLTERSTNFLLMEKLRHGRKAGPLAKAVWRLLLPYKGEALKSITMDNGSEFSGHEWIIEKLHVPVFFADSYCAWRKEPLKMETSWSGSIYPRGWTSVRSLTEKLPESGRKSMPGQGRNSIS